VRGGKGVLKDTGVSGNVIVGRERCCYSQCLITLAAKIEIPRTTERLNIDNTIKDVLKDEEYREVRCKVARSRK
jgi:hypothetical protein